MTAGPDFDAFLAQVQAEAADQTLRLRTPAEVLQQMLRDARPLYPPDSDIVIGLAAVLEQARRRAQVQGLTEKLERLADDLTATRSQLAHLAADLGDQPSGGATNDSGPAAADRPALPGLQGPPGRLVRRLPGRSRPGLVAHCAARRARGPRPARRLVPLGGHGRDAGAGVAGGPVADRWPLRLRRARRGAGDGDPRASPPDPGRIVRPAALQVPGPPGPARPARVAARAGARR